jgi:Family of unknown function (DUF6221)
MTLIEFICARVGYDETAGKLWNERGFTAAATDRPKTPFDPERVLLECEAKRAVIATYKQAIQKAHHDPNTPPGKVTALETVLKQLALPYAQHPDYRPEWSPTFPE